MRKLLSLLTISTISAYASANLTSCDVAASKSKNVLPENVLPDLANMTLDNMPLVSHPRDLYNLINNKLADYASIAGHDVSASDIESAEFDGLIVKILDNKTSMSLRKDDIQSPIEPGMSCYTLEVKANILQKLFTPTNDIISIPFNVKEDIDLSNKSLNFATTLNLTNQKCSDLYNDVRSQLAQWAGYGLTADMIKDNPEIAIAIYDQDGQPISDNDKQLYFGKYEVKIMTTVNQPWFKQTNWISKPMLVNAEYDLNDFIGDNITKDAKADMSGSKLFELVRKELARLITDGTVSDKDIENAIKNNLLNIQILGDEGKTQITEDTQNVSFGMYQITLTAEKYNLWFTPEVAKTKTFTVGY